LILHTYGVKKFLIVLIKKFVENRKKSSDPLKFVFIQIQTVLEMSLVVRNVFSLFLYFFIKTIKNFLTPYV
jgi:hypothetical protein